MICFSASGHFLLRNPLMACLSTWMSIFSSFSFFRCFTETAGSRLPRVALTFFFLAFSLRGTFLVPSFHFCSSPTSRAWRSSVSNSVSDSS